MTAASEQQGKLPYFLDFNHLLVWRAARRGQGAGILHHSLFKTVLAGLLIICELSSADSFPKQLPAPLIQKQSKG